MALLTATMISWQPQLASGTAADIVQIDPETMPSFVSTGDYFLDYKDYDFDLSNFDPNYIGLRVNGNYDGKQLGLPTGHCRPGTGCERRAG